MKLSFSQFAITIKVAKLFCSTAEAGFDWLCSWGNSWQRKGSSYASSGTPYAHSITFRHVRGQQLCAAGSGCLSTASLSHSYFPQLPAIYS